MPVELQLLEEELLRVEEAELPLPLELLVRLLRARELVDELRRVVVVRRRVGVELLLRVGADLRPELLRTANLYLR